MSKLGSTIQSARFQRRFFAFAVIVLVAGVVAVVAARLSHVEKQRTANVPNGPVKDVSKTPKNVKLDPKAQAVAKLFIETAVARKDLAKAYPIAGPGIKQGQTLKQWLTGDIAVVPYPIEHLDIAPMKVVYSQKNEAGIQVALLAKDGTKTKSQLFDMTLERIGTPKRWVVNTWAPHGQPPVPCGDVNC